MPFIYKTAEVFVIGEWDVLLYFGFDIPKLIIPIQSQIQITVMFEFLIVWKLSSILYIALQSFYFLFSFSFANTYLLW